MENSIFVLFVKKFRKIVFDSKQKSNFILVVTIFQNFFRFMLKIQIYYYYTFHVCVQKNRVIIFLGHVLLTTENNFLPEINSRRALIVVGLIDLSNATFRKENSNE